jgi:hypothetical protein
VEFLAARAAYVRVCKRLRLVALDYDHAQGFTEAGLLEGTLSRRVDGHLGPTDGSSRSQDIRRARG